MVRIHLGPPHTSAFGALAQLGERLLCKHQVIGSIPIGSTISQSKRRGSKAAAHYDKNGQRYGARPRVPSKYYFDGCPTRRSFAATDGLASNAPSATT